jgi:uncharacterized protein YlzI (FlbEa/FlbD family)
MLRLTSATDGTPILLNQAVIFSVKSSVAGTAVMSTGGDTVYVKQSLNEVEKRVKAATAA